MTLSWRCYLVVLTIHGLLFLKMLSQLKRIFKQIINFKQWNCTLEFLWKDWALIVWDWDVQDLLQPRVLYQYKNQPAAAQTALTARTVWDCVQYALSFQLVTSLLGNVLLWRFRYQWVNTVTPVLELPSLSGYWYEVFNNIFLIITLKLGNIVKWKLEIRVRTHFLTSVVL